MRPLGHFREYVGGEAPRVLRQEVELAVRGLSLGKAPGPDGLPLLLYRRIPGLMSIMAQVLDEIIQKGKIPVGLTRI